MIKKVVYLVIGIVLLGALIPALWPTVEDTATDVAAMNATTVGGEFIQNMWPVILIIIGLGLGAFLIFWGLRQLGLGGRH